MVVLDLSTFLDKVKGLFLSLWSPQSKSYDEPDTADNAQIYNPKKNHFLTNKHNDTYWQNE